MGVAKTMYDDIAKSFAAAIKEKSEGCYVIDSGWAASALK
jgi:predicted N-acyltransferase